MRRPINLVTPVLTCLALVCPAVAESRLVLNEIHPDPDGSDGGKEFVEILNAGLVSASLAGISISFANGATGGPWEVRWTGTAGLVLEAGDRFLVTDRNWMGEAVPDVEVWLGLQNGPDAVGLMREGEILDLIGYGPLTDHLLMEGSPATLVVGSSLARRPDGHDTGDNGLDLVPAQPTPGEANFQPYEMIVTATVVEPPSLDRPGIPVTVTLALLNLGTEPYPAGAIIVRIGAAESTGYFDGLDPGQGMSMAFGTTPAATGTFDLEVVLPAIPGQPPLDLPAGRYQVGAGSLVLHEVLSIPGDRQGEWIELLNAGPDPVALEKYTLSDSDGDPRGLPEMALDPGGMVVVAQDSTALAEWVAENGRLGAPLGCTAPGVILGLAGWPSLNNAPPDSREYADRITLSDSTGMIIDHLTLGGSGVQGVPVPAGRTLERQAVDPVNPGFSNWLPCGAVTGGTPGCANSVASTGMGTDAVTVEPRILDREAGGVVLIRFEVAPGRSGWRSSIFDLEGHRIRDLGGDDLGSGPRQLVWDGRADDGRDAGPGGYIVLVKLDHRSWRTLVAVR